MDRYRWNILGLFEMGWKNFGKTTTEEGHKVFFSGKEDKHKHGIGFLVHKDIMDTVMGYHPVSSRLITICLRAVPFNTTIVQAYAPMSDYDDNEIEDSLLLLSLLYLFKRVYYKIGNKKLNIFKKEDKIEDFYDQLQNVIDQMPKKDILVVQGDWNAKVGKDACGKGQGFCGPFCNNDTNERGLRLLEFASLIILCW